MLQCLEKIYVALWGGVFYTDIERLVLFQFSLPWLVGRTAQWPLYTELASPVSSLLYTVLLANITTSSWFHTNQLLLTEIYAN